MNLSLAQRKIESFFAEFPQHNFKPGEVIIGAGEPPTHFFFVKSGAVKMTKTTENGRHIVLHIFFPQSFFSLLSLMNKADAEYDFVAMTSTVIYSAPREQVVHFLYSDIGLLLELQQRLLGGLAGLLKRVEQAALTSAYSQVASLLLYFSHHFAEPSDTNTHQLSVKITHQEIADWLGLSRENVSVQMKKLEESNLIKISDRLITIPDSQALLSAATHGEAENL